MKLSASLLLSVMLLVGCGRADKAQQSSTAPQPPAKETEVAKVAEPPKEVPVVPAPAPAAPAATVADPEAVGFDKLASYEFTAPESEAKAAEAEKQIPDRIRELDAKQVTVTGFMLPVKMDAGLVTEFLLVKDPAMCCYGVMPKVTEWVVVKMVGKGVPPLMDVPVTFAGELKVGQLYEGGYLTGLYLLKGEKRVESKG